MFGKNKVLGPVRSQGWTGKYWVQEVFKTIQGEGPWAGWPATFVRLAGCNLACHFCDTDFESGTEHMDAEQITSVARVGGTRRVVITGGEPLRQPIWPLVKSLRASGIEVQIETAGTLWEELPNYMPPPVLVCSPKTASIAKGVEAHCAHYKYIIRASDAIDPSDGLPCVSTQDPARALRLYRPTQKRVTVWLQPCAEYSGTTMDHYRTEINAKFAAALCMKYGYRLSLQLHKIIGLP
jgi:organic radical activating enzyme